MRSDRDLKQVLSRNRGKGVPLSFIANRRRIREVTEDRSLVADAIKTFCEKVKLSGDGNFVLLRDPDILNDMNTRNPTDSRMGVQQVEVLRPRTDVREEILDSQSDIGGSRGSRVTGVQPFSNRIADFHDINKVQPERPSDTRSLSSSDMARDSQYREGSHTKGTGRSTTTNGMQYVKQSMDASAMRNASAYHGRRGETDEFGRNVRHDDIRDTSRLPKDTPEGSRREPNAENGRGGTHRSRENGSMRKLNQREEPGFSPAFEQGLLSEDETIMLVSGRVKKLSLGICYQSLNLG